MLGPSAYKWGKQVPVKLHGLPKVTLVSPVCEMSAQVSLVPMSFPTTLLQKWLFLDDPFLVEPLLLGPTEWQEKEVWPDPQPRTCPLSSLRELFVQTPRQPKEIISRAAASLGLSAGHQMESKPIKSHWQLMSHSPGEEIHKSIGAAQVTKWGCGPEWGTREKWGLWQTEALKPCVKGTTALSSSQLWPHRIHLTFKTYSFSFFFFLVGLGFELRALCLQRRAMPPVHFVLVNFRDRYKNYLLGLASNHDSPDLGLPRG
jgi:hypothetical protein